MEKEYWYKQEFILWLEKNEDRFLWKGGLRFFYLKLILIIIYLRIFKRKEYRTIYQNLSKQSKDIIDQLPPNLN